MIDERNHLTNEIKSLSHDDSKKAEYESAVKLYDALSQDIEEQNLKAKMNKDNDMYNRGKVLDMNKINQRAQNQNKFATTRKKKQSANGKSKLNPFARQPTRATHYWYTGKDEQESPSTPKIVATTMFKKGWDLYLLFPFYIFVSNCFVV